MSENSLIIQRNRITDLRQLTINLRMDGFTADILGWGFYESEWWRNYLHEHSFFEVCYAYAGRGRFRINGMDTTVQAGDVFVAKPGEPHEIVSSKNDPLGIYFWSYTLVPPVEKQSASDTTRLLRSFLTSTQSISNTVPAMQNTLELLTNEIAERQPGYLPIINGLVTKLLLETARAVTETETEPASISAHDPTAMVVADIVRYLQDNYQRPVQLREVAAQVHLSERHTNRLFKQVMGMPVNAYLTQYRLQVAAQLLLNHQTSVTEVAYASGYRDVRYFITRFRQHTGLTPAAFRQQGGTRFFDPIKTVP